MVSAGVRENIIMEKSVDDFEQVRLLSKKEVAGRLGISLSKLAYLTNPKSEYYNANFPKPKHIGRAVKFKLVELIAFINMNQ